MKDRIAERVQQIQRDRIQEEEHLHGHLDELREREPVGREEE